MGIAFGNTEFIVGSNGYTLQPLIFSQLLLIHIGEKFHRLGALLEVLSS